MSFLCLELRPTSKAEVERLLDHDINIYQFPRVEQFRKTVVELFVLGSPFYLSKIMAPQPMKELLCRQRNYVLKAV